MHAARPGTNTTAILEDILLIVMESLFYLFNWLMGVEKVGAHDEKRGDSVQWDEHVRTKLVGGTSSLVWALIAHRFGYVKRSDARRHHLSSSLRRAWEHVASVI